MLRADHYGGTALLIVGSPCAEWLEPSLGTYKALREIGFKVVIASEPFYSKTIGKRIRGEAVFYRLSTQFAEEDTMRIHATVKPSLLVYVVKPGPDVEGYYRGCWCRLVRNTYPTGVLNTFFRKAGIPSIGLYNAPTEMGWRGEAPCNPSPQAFTNYSIRLEKNCFEEAYEKFYQFYMRLEQNE